MRKFREIIQAWWVAAGSCQTITYESQVTIQSQMASTSLTTMAGQVLAAAERVPRVVQIGDKPRLQEEFMDFCMSPLPPKVTAITEVDKYWHAISQIKDCLEPEYHYSTLAKLAKAILVIPHGNADTKRLFSHIGLNKTKHRNRLGISTLNSLNRAIQCSSKML